MCICSYHPRRLKWNQTCTKLHPLYSICLFRIQQKITQFLFKWNIFTFFCLLLCLYQIMSDSEYFGPPAPQKYLGTFAALQWIRISNFKLKCTVRLNEGHFPSISAPCFGWCNYCGLMSDNWLLESAFEDKLFVHNDFPIALCSSVFSSLHSAHRNICEASSQPAPTFPYMLHPPPARFEA